MQWWKSDEGDFPPVFELWTGQGGGDCGFMVQPGKSYLIYGHRTPQGLYFTSSCNRNEQLICAMERDLLELGPPIKTYEQLDTRTLAHAEEPLHTSGPCVTPALLRAERGLRLDRGCVLPVRMVIGRDGAIREFAIDERWGWPKGCPKTLEAQISEQLSKWTFKPGEVRGVPVEVVITSLSINSPMTEREYLSSKKPQH